jgi:predicted Zn-dependent peptidase
MKFKKTKLKNGLRIITVPMKDNPTVTVMVLVEAGSKYETKAKNGLSHFLEHMCFKGTTTRPNTFAISSELDSVGAQSNAFTGTEYTGYYAKAEHRYLPKILDVVTDIYLNPTFPAGELEKEKGVIIEEINMYEDMPHQKVGEVFEELLYGDQPAGWPIIGNKENIRKMTRDDLVNYRNAHYVASSTIVLVAGKMNEAKVIKDIVKKFADIPTGKKDSKLKVKESQKSPQVKLFHKETDQTHFVLGFRAFDIHDKRNWALAALSTILGKGFSSRLFIKMREELGICYYVRASVSSSTDHGYFSVAAGVGNARAKEAVEVLCQEFKKVLKSGVTAVELQKAKNLMIGSLALDLESSDDYTNFYGSQEIYREPLLTREEQIKKIEKVTIKDVENVAKDIFQKKGINLAVVGPFKDQKDFLSLLSI